MHTIYGVCAAGACVGNLKLRFAEAQLRSRLTANAILSEECDTQCDTQLNLALDCSSLPVA